MIVHMMLGVHTLLLICCLIGKQLFNRELLKIYTNSKSVLPLQWRVNDAKCIGREAGLWPQGTGIRRCLHSPVFTPYCWVYSHISGMPGEPISLLHFACRCNRAYDAKLLLQA
jgi:hypothetical protein